MSTPESAGPPADAISLGNEEAVKEVVWKSVLGLWDLINELTRLQPSHRERYRVSILRAGGQRVRWPGLRAPDLLHAAPPVRAALRRVAPGGIGTVLEMLMIWQLLQVRHIRDVPLILVGRMWPGLVEWARASMLSMT